MLNMLRLVCQALWISCSSVRLAALLSRGINQQLTCLSWLCAYADALLVNLIVTSRRIIGAPERLSLKWISTHSVARHAWTRKSSRTIVQKAVFSDYNFPVLLISHPLELGVSRHGWRLFLEQTDVDTESPSVIASVWPRDLRETLPILDLIGNYHVNCKISSTTLILNLLEPTIIFDENWVYALLFFWNQMLRLNANL